MDNKRKNGSVPKDVLDQFGEDARAEIRLVWEQAGKLQKTAAEPGDSDVEAALQKVHRRMAPGPPAENEGGRIPRIVRYSRYLAAAVALIVATVFYLFVPKTVTVPHGEIATLELPDGSSVEMNSGSTLRYSRLYRFTGRNMELNGEAYFSVEDAPGRPFTVETGETVIEVTGTRFNVRSWSNDPSGETTVTVSEGEVWFYPRKKREQRISLTAGETGRWHPALTEPGPPEQVEIEDVLAWRDQRFVFRDQPLISILSELERRYDVRIDLNAEGVGQSTLTAYYSEGIKLESILDDICTVKGLRYTKTTTGYRIFK